MRPRAGEALRLASVVAVTVATLGGELAIHAELLDVSEAKVLAEETVVALLTARGRALRATFGLFGKQVRDALAAREATLPSTEGGDSRRGPAAPGSVVVDAAGKGGAPRRGCMLRSPGWARSSSARWRWALARR